MSSTVQRIKEYIDFKGITVKKFEELVGFSNGSFGSQYKNNKTIGVDKVEYILSVFSELSPDWLLTGQGEMIKNPIVETTALLVVPEVVQKQEYKELAEARLEIIALQKEKIIRIENELVHFRKNEKL